MFLIKFLKFLIFFLNLFKGLFEIWMFKVLYLYFKSVLVLCLFKLIMFKIICFFVLFFMVLKRELFFCIILLVLFLVCLVL